MSRKSLEIDIAEILNEYTTEVREKIEKSVNKVVDETLEELKKTSPKKTGKYARAWTSKEVDGVIGKSKVIYNKRGQLTHLLEFGHAISNGKGRTRAFPHIKPAEEKAIKSFEEILRNEIEK